MGRTRRRRPRRNRGHATEKVNKIVQPLWKLPVYELMDEEKVALVHDRSMQILEEAGIAFYEEESLAILRAHGADVGDDSVVRFGRDLVMEYVAKAPEQYEWTARNPEKSVTIGGDHVVFSPVVGPPFVSDMARGRREGTAEDLVNFIKMSQASPYIHNLGSEICVPGDIPMHERHLEQMLLQMTYGDKPTMGAYGIGLMAQDSVDMMKVIMGEEVLSKHYLHCIINVSSPRRLDDRMLSVIRSYAAANQIVNVTPFILSGAMGPISILGTVAQLNAETLAGIVFTQMVNPGTPCVYGSFQAIIDLQSGAPVFGAPESQLALYLSAQMARHYQLPFRAAGSYASSKVIDAQGAYEAVLAMFPSMLVRPNFVLHAAGWLENGLVAGYEKFVLDCEMLGMMTRYLEGVSWDEDEWAMQSLLHDVQPGGHHLGTSHTMRHMKTAFYRAELFDYDSAETWQSKGAPSTIERAHKKVGQILGDYEKPPTDPAMLEALRAWIDERKKTVDPAAFN